MSVDKKVQEILKHLEQGILDTLNSTQFVEKFKAFLNVQSQFHNYSFNNSFLIYLQNPIASRVAGYKTWEKLGRHVMKGQKGISILAPNPYTYYKWIDKLDPKTNQPIKNPVTGQIIKEKVELKGLRFKKVYVFDISQTQGKELPSLIAELKGNSINAEQLIDGIKKISSCEIIYTNTGEAKGYYSRTNNLIAIKENMSLDQTAKTLIHEYAHSILHNTLETNNLDRATQEVQAESVAYVVSNRFGLDTSSYSFNYLSAWSSGKELLELKKSFNLIQKTSDKVIQKLEDVFIKQIELENSHVKIKILWSEALLPVGKPLDYHEAKQLYNKLDKEQKEALKNNPKIDFTKITADERITDFVPYLKTKFEIILSNGTKSNARFDIGNSGYDNFEHCIKKSCYIDVKQYVKQQEALKIKEPVVIEHSNYKEDVIKQYSKSYPAIKHITYETAKAIDNINKQHSTPLSIKEIKSKYKYLGKEIEVNNTPKNINAFNELKVIVDDLKQAQLKEKQLHAKNTTLEKGLSNQTIELVQ